MGFDRSIKIETSSPEKKMKCIDPFDTITQQGTKTPISEKKKNDTAYTNKMFSEAVIEGNPPSPGKKQKHHEPFDTPTQNKTNSPISGKKKKKKDKKRSNEEISETIKGVNPSPELKKKRLDTDDKHTEKGSETPISGKKKKDRKHLNEKLSETVMKREI